MILLDIDGVCMNMFGAIKKKQPNFKPEKVLAYDFSKGDYGIPRELVFKLLTEPEVFALQEEYSHVQEGISLLKQIDVIRGYTSVPKNCVEIRKEHMKRLGIKGYIFNGDKDLIEDAFALIDDNPSEMEKYKDTNTFCILIDRPYNREYKSEHVMRVKNLIEAGDYLLEKITIMAET